MQKKPPLSLVAIAAPLLTGLLFASSAAFAQDQGGSSGGAAERETRRTPAMREKVYQKLAEAQACAEMDDMQCARKLLDQVRVMTDLNSYEQAQMWNFYAYIYYTQDNFREAMTAYENVLKQPDLPVGLETSTMYTLAQLYTQQEDYPKALQMLDRWFALQENPAPEPYYLKAQIHYQLRQYREGLAPIQTALRIAEQQGKAPQEGWYVLLNVLYFELEDYPNVIKTLTVLAERWPKKDYVVQLAGIYGQEGQEDKMLALYEAAYAAGWLQRGTEIVQLAQMLLQADIPYKAASLLNKGLDDGTIESTEANWRLLAQAWQLSQDDEKALPALTRAAGLAADGELDVMLARSYANLARWDKCTDAAQTGLRKGKLKRDDQANLILGNCLIELKKYNDARAAFRTAAQDDRSRRNAQQWLQYIENQESRERTLANMGRRR